MANFTTAIAEENEIIKAADVSYGYEASITNVALALQGVLGGASGNYVIGGAVSPYAGGGLNVTIAPLYAYCADTEQAVVETDTTGPISLEEEEDADRIDIIEVQGLEEGYDYQVRMFNDPSSGTKSSESMNTKKRLSLSVVVKKGTPGAAAAPSVDAGYIKLAEVTVYAGNNAIQESQIANITARGYGSANDGWTTDAAASYNPGELTQAFSAFLEAHNEDGSHKTGVIDRDDIDWGTGSSQVNGARMPTGQSASLYGKSYASSESVTSLLLNLVSHVNALYPFANNIFSRYAVADVVPVAASTENVDIEAGGVLAVDGIAVSEGQAVLLKDQTDAVQNGIWRVNGTGAWTRYEGYAASDAEALTHKLIYVSGGKSNAGKVYYLEGDAYQIGTDALEFVESGLSPQALPGTVAIRDADGQLDGGRVVIPTSTPSSTTDGLIWLTESYINGAIGGKSCKAPLRESVDCLYNGKFHVYTVEGLKAWADYMKESEDYSVDCILHNSLDMEGAEWTPVGTEENPYTGLFDGAGHSLHNLYAHVESEDAAAYAGLFGYLGAGAAVQDLRLVDADVSAVCGSSSHYAYAGALAGYVASSQDAPSRIERVAASGGKIAASNTATTSCAYTGGIAGYCYNYSTLSSCTNSGTVTGSSYYTGGIAGRCNSYCTISSCTNSGTVTGSGSYTGGIAGYCYYCTISSCTNSGTVTGSGNYTGGIAGYCHNYCTISGCTNNANVSGNTSSGYAGGIVGCLYAFSGSYRSAACCCANRGSVSGKYTGYIAGGINSSSYCLLQYNTRVSGPSSECGYTG